MPRATYTLELELTYNTWTAITADWHTALPLIIERGIEPGERVAQIGRMTVWLYNPDGRYVPGHANVRPGFEVGIGVRLKANDGTNTYTLFYGRIAAITPRQGDGEGAGARRALPLQDQMVEVVCEDDMAALYRERLDLFPLILSATPQALVDRLVNRGFVPPGLAGYWRLGDPDTGKLSAKLPGTLTGKDFDAGQSVFPWAGDTWTGNLRLADALRDVMASEGGWFYLAADGTPTFDDRHARPKATTPDATLSGSLGGLEADRRDDRVINRLAITVYPRQQAIAEAVLWQSQTSIKVLPEEPRRVFARYTDPDQQAAIVGALDVVTPLRNVDFTGTTEPGGGGQDRSAHIDVAVEIGASSSLITLVSRWPRSVPIYVHNLRLRGRPLRAFQPATVIVDDEPSFLNYGRRTLALDLPLQADPAVAGDMAHALLRHRKDPHPWLEVAVEATASASLLTHGLARDVGDRLHVTDAALALDGAACFVDGLRHEIERGGASHRVMWRTSPADLTAYWLLGQTGFGEIGQVTWLGY